MTMSTTHELLSEINGANAGILHRSRRNKIAQDVSAVIRWIETTQGRKFEQGAPKLIKHFEEIVIAHGGPGGDRRNPKWAAAAACEAILFDALHSTDVRETLQASAAIRKASGEGGGFFGAVVRLAGSQPWLVVAIVFGLVFAANPARVATNLLFESTFNECMMNRLPSMQSEQSARTLASICRSMYPATR